MGRKLEPGRAVLFVLVAANSMGMNEANTSIIFLTPISTPSKPLNVSYLQVPGKADILKWAAPSFSGGCRIKQYFVEESFRRKNSDAWSAPNHIVLALNEYELNLNCNEMYRWRVRAENDAGGSNWTSELLSSEPISPSAPVRLNATHFTDTAIEFQWSLAQTGSCSLGKYHVELDREDKNIWVEKVKQISTTKTTLKATGLHCNTKYRWRVRSETRVGNSSWSYQKIANTKRGPPSEVCSISSVGVTPVSVTLSWDLPCRTCGNDIIKYELRARLVSSHESNWLPLEGGTDAPMIMTRSHAFVGLDVDTEYEFGVRAVSQYGSGAWKYIRKRTNPRISCPSGSPKALCTTGLNTPKTCSCHGICHAWDGTCACYGGWKGADCNTPDGVKMTFIFRDAHQEWGVVEKDKFRTHLATAVNIDVDRVPPEFVEVNIEDLRMRRLGQRGMKVTFLIVNPLQKAGPILSGPSAAEVHSMIERSILEGSFTAFAILSFRDSSGKQISAPPLPSCTYVDSDSCAPCVGQRGCGWGDGNHKWCFQGDKYGPSFMQQSVCDAKYWRFGSSDKCAPTTIEICNAHRSCGSCVRETKTSCGWCAETARCIPKRKKVALCPNWGFTEAVCTGTCSKQEFQTQLSGFVWLGDNHVGSELFYRENKHCKWHVAPGQHPEPEKYVEIGKLEIVLHRADIEKGDRLTVYDGNSQSADGILIDINGNSMTESSFPINVNSDSTLVIFEFSSDRSPQTVGTGFLASYTGHPRTIWDSYILLSMTSVVLITICCCLCFRCSRFTPGREGMEVENDFGLDLQATENGANIESIKKFPTFLYSDEHKMKLVESEQELACSICLGDYENEEEIRLLPCGHMFHSPCIDAWLQINRICPLCKADVYVVADQKRRGKKKERRKKMMNKLLRRRTSEVSPSNKEFMSRQEELLDISSKKPKSKKKRSQKKNSKQSSLSNGYRAGSNGNQVAPASEPYTENSGRLRVSPPALRFPGHGGQNLGWAVNGGDSSDEEFHERRYHTESPSVEMTSISDRVVRNQSTSPRESLLRLRMARPGVPPRPILSAPVNTTDDHGEDFHFEGDVTSDDTTTIRRRGRGSVLV